MSESYAGTSYQIHALEDHRTIRIALNLYIISTFNHMCLSVVSRADIGEEDKSKVTIDDPVHINGRDDGVKVFSQ